MTGRAAACEAAPLQGGRSLETYRAAARPATVEQIRKKSRFIAYVEPVDSADEAEAVLARLRERHRDATHVCYAYRAGWPSTVVRMSDDGEPQGTAGRPILDVLERQGVDNTCIAVVRYFGGTLLGAAGLVRAYAGAAAEALSAAGIATYRLHVTLSICLEYPHHQRVTHLLDELGATLVASQFTDIVELTVVVPEERVDAVTQRLADATGGTARVSRSGQRYFPALDG